MPCRTALLRRFASVPLLLAAPCVAQTAAAPAAQAPSSLVQTAIGSVARAGSAVDLNKWKGSTAARDEVDANLASMQKDVQDTLPPLLAAADAAPDSPSASLPVLLNLDALYSVLLRVTIASRNSAPRDQNATLEQSAAVLDGARRDLGDTILASSKAQERRVADLQATVQQQAAALAAATAPQATPDATGKTKRKKTAAAAKPSNAQ